MSTKERWFCYACDDWQPVEHNVHRDDMTTCWVCGSDEVHTEAEYELEFLGPDYDRAHPQ